VSAIFICQQILLKTPKIKFNEIGVYDVKNNFWQYKILPIEEDSLIPYSLKATEPP
jgi:hypothetical protein